MNVWRGIQPAERKPFSIRLHSKNCIRNDGFSSPVDFITTVKEPKTLAGDREIALEDFDMPNYLETFENV